MNIYAALSLCFLPLIATGTVLVISRTVPPLQALLSVALALVIVVGVSALEVFALRLPLPQMDSAAAALLSSILLVGLMEELSKALILFALPLGTCRSGTDKVLLTDGQFVVCALLCGISVGGFESVAYFLNVLVRASDMGAAPVYGNIFARIFTADVLHTLCAGLGGLFTLSIRRRRMADVLSLFWAVVLHGLYDYFNMDERGKVLAIVAILLAAVELRIRYRRLTDSNKLTILSAHNTK